MAKENASRLALVPGQAPVTSEVQTQKEEAAYMVIERRGMERALQK